MKNLAAQGYPLIGGGLDYFRGHAVAVLVYSRGKHVIDLYVWPSPLGIAVPADDEQNGYHLVHWTTLGMSLTAVSDVDSDALHEFVRDWQQPR